MKKNYTQRLEKLKNRRLDEQLQKAVLSKSFSDIRIGESVKYALESMSPIDPSYTRNTYLASENIRNNLIVIIISNIFTKKNNDEQPFKCFHSQRTKVLSNFKRHDNRYDCSF